jgi:S-adenosylmethionine hydrolase
MSAVSGTLSGKVVEIDESGNLITDILVEKLASAPHDTSLRIVVDEHETYGLYPSDHQQPALTLVAISDGSGPLKISLVSDSASAMLGVKIGASVEIYW